MWFNRFLLSLGVVTLNMVKLPRREGGAELGVERGGVKFPSLFGEDSAAGGESMHTMKRFSETASTDSSTYFGSNLPVPPDLSWSIPEIAGMKYDALEPGSRSRSYLQAAASTCRQGSSYTTLLCRIRSVLSQAAAARKPLKY